MARNADGTFQVSTNPIATVRKVADSYYSITRPDGTTAGYSGGQSGALAYCRKQGWKPQLETEEVKRVRTAWDGQGWLD